MDGAQFTALRSRVNTATIGAILRLWSSLDSWRDGDATQFVAQAVPLARAGQSTVAQLTSAFIADQAGDAFHTTVAPPTVPSDLIDEVRGGVEPAEVYRRPFVEVYTALSRGRTLLEAVTAGGSRLDEIADLELQRAYSLAAAHAMNTLPGRYQPEHWRRRTTGAHSCALCVVASTHRYSRGDLHPIHRHCDCRVEPDYGGSAGQIADDGILGRVHTAVQELLGTSDSGARSPDYRQLVVDMTAVHGELGPLLVRPRDHFTGPGEI